MTGKSPSDEQSAQEHDWNSELEVLGEQIKSSRGKKRVLLVEQSKHDNWPVEKLLHAAQHPDTYVRMAAVKGLVGRGLWGSLALIKLALDRHKNVRQLALEAIQAEEGEPTSWLARHKRACRELVLVASPEAPQEQLLPFLLLMGDAKDQFHYHLLEQVWSRYGALLVPHITAEQKDLLPSLFFFCERSGKGKSPGKKAAFGLLLNVLIELSHKEAGWLALNRGFSQTFLRALGLLQKVPDDLWKERFAAWEAKWSKYDDRNHPDSKLSKWLRVLSDYPIVGTDSWERHAVAIRLLLRAGQITLEGAVYMVQSSWRTLEAQPFLAGLLVDIFADYGGSRDWLQSLIPATDPASIPVLVSHAAHSREHRKTALYMMGRIPTLSFALLSGLLGLLQEEGDITDVERVWSRLLSGASLNLPQDEIFLLLRQFLSFPLDNKVLSRAFQLFLEKLDQLLKSEKGRQELTLDHDMLIDYVDMHVLEENRKRLANYKPWTESLLTERPSAMLRLVHQLNMYHLCDMGWSAEPLRERLKHIFSHEIINHIKIIHVMQVQHADLVLEALAGSLQVGEVTTLFLQSTPLRDDDIAKLAEVTSLPSLRKLYLSGCHWLTASGIEQLIDSPMWPQLTHLGLKNLTIDEPTVIERLLRRLVAEGEHLEYIALDPAWRQSKPIQTQLSLPEQQRVPWVQALPS